MFFSYFNQASATNWKLHTIPDTFVYSNAPKVFQAHIRIKGLKKYCHK